MGRTLHQNALNMVNKPVLVAGATGYVGGRLVPRMLSRGFRVRAMARTPGKVACRPWAGYPNLEIVAADMLAPESLRKAAEGCRAVYYLVHSMNPQSKDFVENDRKAARNMVAAAAAGGVERIIYLGGLGEESTGLSEHLRSRREVAHILQSGPVPVTFLRAAMILGSGSASFEMLRYLTERLPVLLTPKWVYTQCQPIAIRNVLDYLIGCLEHEETAGATFDIGGPDILCYRDLFGIYAEEARLPKRIMVPVPFLTPRLSGYWIHLVTPVPASLARPLTEGLKNRVVCRDNRIRAIIPLKLISCRESIRLALERVQQETVETCWSDSGYVCPPEWIQTGDAGYAGGTVLDCAYRVRLRGTPEQVWEPIARIGGQTGWYFAHFLWSLRGFLDSLAGGVGLRRGRRNPREIRAGDALDFWRVLSVDPSRRLVLLAEMKVPGDALLEFTIEPKGKGEVELQQVSRFLPRGLFGLAYWYALYPFHDRLFKGMLKAISRQAGAAPINGGPERFLPGKIQKCSL